MNIEGNEDLKYVEQGDYLTLTGGSADQQTIKDYVTLFEPTDWTLQNDYQTDKVAIFTIEKTVPNDFLYLEINICCIDSEGYLANAGTFLMNVFGTLQSSVLTSENTIKQIITNYYAPNSVENIDSLISKTEEGLVWEITPATGQFSDVETYFDKVESILPDYINTCLMPKTISTNMQEIAPQIYGSMWVDEALNVGVRILGWTDTENTIHIQTTVVQF